MIDIVTCPKCQGSGRELMLQAHSEDYCYGGTCPECQGIGAVSVSRLDLADCDRLAADLATARTEIERLRAERDWLKGRWDDAAASVIIRAGHWCLDPDNAHHQAIESNNQQLAAFRAAAGRDADAGEDK